MGWEARMLALFVLATAAQHGLGDSADETRLRALLRERYDPQAKPSQEVIVNFNSFKIIGLDVLEKTNEWMVRCYMSHTWEDHRLAWDPSEFGNLTQLAMRPTEVWRPDLALYSGTPMSDLPVTDLPIVLYPTGMVLFVPNYELRSTCSVDLTYWPNDVHNCSVKIGSWTHNADLLDLVINGTVPEIDKQFMKNVAWSVSDLQMIRHVQYYDCCPEPYVDVEVSLLLTRDANAFCWIVKAPIICLSLLALVVLVLPPSAGEKVVFGGLVVIADIIFLNFASSMIGFNPANTPLIVQLVSQQMVLVMVVVLVSAVVVRLAKGPHTKGLPPAVKKTSSALASILLLGNYKIDNGSKAEEAEMGGNGGMAQAKAAREWLLLAALLDRLALLLYLAIFVISLIRFSSVL